MGTMSEIEFVNRVAEIEELRNWCSMRRATPMYIYGPEGCGKTRLLKEFVRNFNKFFIKNAIAIYIDALESESIDKAILVPKTVKLSKEILESIVEKFTGFNIGKVLSNSISTILEKAVLEKRIRDNIVLVVVDDVVKVIGLERIERYVKWLYELMWKIRDKYRPKAINFIVTTSEDKSLKLVERHRHTYIVMLWNLDKNSFKQLFYKLNPSNKVDFEEVWRLFGGNPGKLIELAENYNWNTEIMINTYSEKVRKVLREIVGKGLEEELKILVEDPDNADKISTEKMGEVVKTLVKYNMFMYVGLLLTGLRKPKPDSQMGIGKYFAWQIPLYKNIFKTMLT